MRDLVRLIVWMVVDLMRSQATLEAELLTLRQQINVLRRTAPKKQYFSVIDRLVFVCLYRLFPKVCDALAIVKPDTIVRWHRAGFRSYWRCTSRPRGGRPAADSIVWRYIASDRRMDLKSAHGNLRPGTSAPLSDPRAGWGLWRGL